MPKSRNLYIKLCAHYLPQGRGSWSGGSSHPPQRWNSLVQRLGHWKRSWYLPSVDRSPRWSSPFQQLLTCGVDTALKDWSPENHPSPRPPIPKPAGFLPPSARVPANCRRVRRSPIPAPPGPPHAVPGRGTHTWCCSGYNPTSAGTKAPFSGPSAHSPPGDPAPAGSFLGRKC